ncbi:MAG: ABC transporter ATP-binding protein [Candidatus Brockarchaeota archaeon]|nr:ABC transporter ATP-binding protein [Candidatus Brockarchaeota archaeon]MBO3768218.1 ABC transporter ATP-binding protein [Candidatus Brockarchaeota archaeon]
MAEISIEDVSFSYEQDRENNFVLKNINYSILPGDSVLLLGPNGSGKTTLLKLIMGLLKPTKGKIKIDNLDTNKLSVFEISKKVSMIFQNPEKQFFAETVREELSFGLKNRGLREEEIKMLVDEVSKKFGLFEYLDRSPFDLSGGEKRRLSIASIAILDPEVLIVDEPTAGLDFQYRNLMVGILREFLKTKNKSLIIATHDIDFGLRIANKAAVIDEGKLIWNGDIVSLLKEEEIFSKGILTHTFASSLISKLILQSNVDFQKVVKGLEELAEGLM